MTASNALALPRIGWAALLGAIAAALTAGSAVLHFMGLVSQRRFLAHWNVDANLFPQSHQQAFLSGYDAMLIGLVAIWQHSRSQFVEHVVTLALVVLAGVLLGWATHKLEPGAAKALLALRRQHRVVQLLAGTLPAAVAVLLFVHAGLVLVAAGLAFPFLVAERAAAAQAQWQTEHHAKGCDALPGRCIEVKRNNHPDVTGFLLGSSTTHVAVLDATTGTVKTFSREGVETTTFTQTDRAVFRCASGQSC